jgi:hypothetical protein
MSTDQKEYKIIKYKFTRAAKADMWISFSKMLRRIDNEYYKLVGSGTVAIDDKFIKRNYNTNHEISKRRRIVMNRYVERLNKKENRRLYKYSKLT